MLVNASFLRVIAAWIAVFLSTLPMYAQQRDWHSFAQDGRNQNPTSPEVIPSDQSPPSVLEGLVRKYTSSVDLAGAGGKPIGKVRMIWLKDDLLKAVVEEYARKNLLPPAEIAKLKSELSRKLQTSRSYPFLVSVQPAENGLIGRPLWIASPNGQKQYPSILLRGTGNYISGPVKWSQILGENTPGYFASDTTGYVIYKSDRDAGGPIVQADDFSFSLEYRCQAVSQNTKYNVEAEFHYDLMPIPIQSIIDAKIKSWNPGLARISVIPEYRADQPDDGRRVVYNTQDSSTSLTRSEIIGIIGLAISFAQFLVMVL
jgi:hypothetical protein